MSTTAVYDAAAREATKAVGADLPDLIELQKATIERMDAWWAAYFDAMAHGPEEAPALTAKEAATRLGCSIDTVYDLAHRGTLRRVAGLGRAVRVRRDDVERLLNGEEPLLTAAD